MHLKRPILTLLALMLSLGLGLSQVGVNSSTGAKSLSLGLISSTLSSSDAIFNNFSNVTQNNFSFGAIVNSQRRFSLSELTTSQLGVHSKVGSFGHAGLMVSNYGFSEYKEQKISLNYARKLMDELSLSLNLDYNILQINENGSQSHLSYGIGASGNISESSKYGIYIFNFENSSETTTPSSTYIQIGFSNQISKKAIAHAEIEKLISENPNFKVGIDYSLVQNFNLRLGYQSTPGTFAFGFGYLLLDRYNIDFGIGYNTLLGMTPSISLAYLSKKTL